MLHSSLLGSAYLHRGLAIGWQGATAHEFGPNRGVPRGIGEDRTMDVTDRFVEVFGLGQYASA
jgi:hypothetical protein